MSQGSRSVTGAVTPLVTVLVCAEASMLPDFGDWETEGCSGDGGGMAFGGLSHESSARGRN